MFNSETEDLNTKMFMKSMEKREAWHKKMPYEGIL